MAWFLITMRCSAGHVWKRRTKNPDSPDPPCPILDCESRRAFGGGDRMDIPTLETPPSPPIGMDLTMNKAPAVIGGNIQVKAIDETASIVMEDHGMTDLRSDVRETESMAPKLHPRLQAQADAFFGGGGRRMQGVNLGRHAAVAMAGGLRDPVSTDRSIGATHRQQLRAPTNIVADDRLLRR